MSRARGRKVARSGALFLMLALAPVASAQPASSPPGSFPAYPPPPNPAAPASYAQARAPGARTHDGFYLRMQLGGGYTSMGSSSSRWSSTTTTDRSIDGGSSGFGIALGGALTPHVIIYGTFIDSTIREPNQGTLSGPTSNTGAADGMLNGAVDLGGFGRAGLAAVGAGMAYYLDSNLFFAGSLLASRLFVQAITGDLQARSALGFTFEGLFGKEWWVSDNWALGVCGRMLLGTMQDRPYVSEPVSTWKLASFAVLFSATYN